MINISFSVRLKVAVSNAHDISNTIQLLIFTKNTNRYSKIA